MVSVVAQKQRTRMTHGEASLDVHDVAVTPLHMQFSRWPKLSLPPDLSPLVFGRVGRAACETFALSDAALTRRLFTRSDRGLDLWGRGAAVSLRAATDLDGLWRHRRRRNPVAADDGRSAGAAAPRCAAFSCPSTGAGAWRPWRARRRAWPPSLSPATWPPPAPLSRMCRIWPSRIALVTDPSCPTKPENVIILGSENRYTDSGFWLKCMFLACGFGVAQGRIPPPDRLRNRVHRGKVHQLRSLVVFSHGTPGRLALDCTSWTDGIGLPARGFTRLPPDILAPADRIFSHACPPAVTRGRGGSRAQILASHVDLTVRAFRRLANDRDVMPQHAKSADIAATLVAARTTRVARRIDLPPDHEAFPTPGPGSGMIGPRGASAEGSEDYAQWRKAGAIELPAGGSTLPDQPAGRFALTPS